jgi:hypothetical protein
MPYESRVDRNNPSSLIFMVDQSASMADPIWGAEVSRAGAVTEQLNWLLYELVQRCTKSLTGPPWPYFGVAIFGYRTDQAGNSIVKSLLGGALADQQWVWTTDLAQHPLRIEERTNRTSDTGGQRYSAPVWIEAAAEGGTPMCEAMHHAGRLARSWIEAYPKSFPPIVINLSDGEPTDGDPSEWARRLQGLSTADGNLLLFNLDIGSGQSTLFPHELAPGVSPYARKMFEMSSPLPEMMVKAAQAQGYPAVLGSRGFGMNADFRSVVTFLNVGTSVQHLLR